MAQLPLSPMSAFDISFPGQMRALQQSINQLFSGFPFSNSADFLPQLDLVQNEDRYALTVELPGMKSSDVSVSLDGGILTIRGEKKSEKEQKDQKRHIVERSYGSFVRSVQVPEDVKAEDVKATMEDGVLKIEFPAPVKENRQAKTIEVKATDKGGAPAAS